MQAWMPSYIGDQLTYLVNWFWNFNNSDLSINVSQDTCTIQFSPCDLHSFNLNPPLSCFWPKLDVRRLTFRVEEQVWLVFFLSLLHLPPPADRAATALDDAWSNNVVAAIAKYVLIKSASNFHLDIVRTWWSLQESRWTSVMPNALQTIIVGYPHTCTTQCLLQILPKFITPCRTPWVCWYYIQHTFHVR